MTIIVSDYVVLNPGESIFGKIHDSVREAMNRTEVYGVSDVRVTFQERYITGASRYAYTVTLSKSLEHGQEE